MARKINRHAMLRKHKRKLKQKYGRGPMTAYRTNTRLHEDECRERYGEDRNVRTGGYTYWQTCYLTGPRQFAKRSTNRAIRAMYRDMMNLYAAEDAEEIQALRGADYEKIYDYDYTIW